MLIFGHLGIGIQIARPWMGDPKEGLRARTVLLGCLLPDLIDKPLYYSMHWATGLSGDALGLISGTRTLGHTLFFVLILGLGAWWRRSLWLAALCLGVGTHLALDHAGEFLAGLLGQDLSDAFDWGSRRVQGLFFPFFGARFPEYPFQNMKEHAGTFLSPHLWTTEILGAFFLVRDYLRFSKSWRR